MPGLIARFFLVIAGFFAGWFVSPDAVNFSVVQMTIAVLLFAIFVAIAAFWPNIRNQFKRWFKK